LEKQQNETTAAASVYEHGEPSAKHVKVDGSSNYTQDVTDNEVTTTNKTQGNNNQETLKRKRKQAAERVRLCRTRKREQLLTTTRVMCRTASNEQPTTPPSLSLRPKTWKHEKAFHASMFLVVN
jgi:hypothetical protein